VEGSAAPNIVSDFLEKEKKDYSRWVPVYITGVCIIGIIIAIYALSNIPDKLDGFPFFLVLTAVSQILGVQLFKKSRSYITFGSALSIACIPLFGLSVAVLLGVMGGLTSILSDFIFYKERRPGRAPWWQRSAFNAGMFIIANAMAAWVFLAAGGTVGNVAQISNVIPIILAGIVDYFFNMALLMGVVGLSTSQDPRKLWKRDHSWNAPGSIMADTIGGSLIALTFEINIFLPITVFLLIMSLSYFSSRFYVKNMQEHVDELEKANLKLERSQLGLLKTLGTVIDAYDAYTFGHSTQVAVYAEAIAEKMDLKKSEKDLIVKAGLVHDIGKVGVMDAIIGKQGKLTDEEYRLVKRHPDIGAEILGLMEGFEDIVPLVRYHHERWDGSGYPMGLKGEEIPLGARILAVADTVDAMFSDRPYRKSPTYDEVMEEILRCMGTQFDPKVVHAFYAVVQERGPSFFKNSANIVDHKVQRQDAAAIGENVRYLKRSMLGEVQGALEQEQEVEMEVSQD
jgi:putative nucleotidyltransferase with HDIG domain